ncbi:uncharacterized protein PSANT_00723 [Moesziomyces antarcticus]|uniref:BLUF domain-containing protein n=2 Tax=Pseudozyma antarctica TaxID=84753 RepID=A0A5C3FI08_PSEA2|nr:uncharacterized protein PSANT_00723 [Moesziomyces antarcticus]
MGSMGMQRPTVHLEHPPSIPRSSYMSSDSTVKFDVLSSPARPPASFTRSSSSRGLDASAPPKRPLSNPSSRQSSSDSIDSVSSSTSYSRSSPISSIDTPSTTDASSAEEDDLIQTVYTSSARSRHMSTDEVKSILRASRTNNSRLGITGLLLYRDGTFAQFLEGPAEAVDALYDSIERDPRHHGVIRVLRQSVTKRDFKQWSMAFRDLDMIRHRSPSAGSDEVGHEISPEDQVNEGFSQLMNVGLRVGDPSDDEYRPDALGNAKLDLPADMSAPMRKLVTTFYRLMDRPL